MLLDADSYHQVSAVPMFYETHSGEDVSIYARGPMAHLFSGVKEQNYIAFVMAHAACVGNTGIPCEMGRGPVATPLQRQPEVVHQCPPTDTSNTKTVRDTGNSASRHCEALIVIVFVLVTSFGVH